MDKISAMLKDNTNDAFSLERIVSDYTHLYGKSPEEIICEKEVYGNYLKIIPAFLGYLDKNDRRILLEWVFNKKDQKQIAKLMGITQQAVSSRINKFPHKFQKYFYRILSEQGLEYLNAEDLITQEPLGGALKNKLVGMPYENFVKHGEGGYFGKHYGKKEYKTKIVCRMPEYLQNSLCTLCDACTRKSNREGMTYNDSIS